MTPLRAADIFDKRAKLLAEGNEDFVFVFDRFYGWLLDVDRRGIFICGWYLTVEEGDELLSSALGAECERNGRESVDGIQAKEDIVVLCLWSTFGPHY